MWFITHLTFYVVSFCPHSWDRMNWCFQRPWSLLRRTSRVWLRHWKKRLQHSGGDSTPRSWRKGRGEGQEIWLKILKWFHICRSKSPTSTMTCSKVPAWSLWSMEDSVAPKTDREFETCPFSLTQFVLHRNWSFWRHFSLKSSSFYLVIFCWHFQGWKLCWARNVDMRNL